MKETNVGKAIQVKRRAFRDGQPITKVTSSFLYRDHFTDFENTLETVDEPDCVVELVNDTNCSVAGMASLGG